MNKTQIEWAKNPDGSQGYTWNPITGCLNHVNGHCKGGNFPCYAYRLAHGRLKNLYLKQSIYFPDRTYSEEAYTDPFYPRFWPERCNRTGMVMGKPSKGIFVCDMSDLFGIGVPEEWTRKVLDICKAMVFHRFYLLTKQPQNLIKFSPFPDNCWVGTTITNNDAYYQSNSVLLELARIEAKVKYISFEPLLEEIQASGADTMWMDLKDAGINWLIIGACTGTRPDMEALIKRYPDLTLMQWGKKWTSQPKIEWVQEILVAAHNANIPVFMKGNLQPLIDSESCWAGWELRQEMPEDWRRDERETDNILN